MDAKRFARRRRGGLSRNVAALVRGDAARIVRLTLRRGAARASFGASVIRPMDRRRPALYRAVCASDADAFQRICRHFLHNCIWHLERRDQNRPARRGHSAKALHKSLAFWRMKTLPMTHHDRARAASILPRRNRDGVAIRAGNRRPFLHTETRRLQHVKESALVFNSLRQRHI